MKRLRFTSTAVIAAAAVLGAACSSSAGSLGPAPAAPSSKSPSALPSTRPSIRPTPTGSPARPFTYQVWFALNGKLFESWRIQPFTPAVGRLALLALLAGPTTEERQAGIGTMIPGGTRLQDLTIASGIATVDLSPEFRPGGGDVPPLAVAQVVYSITQFSTVRQVVLRVNGGELFETPQSRDGYTSDLPAILVESPQIGSTVSSPVTVAGTANVFEATVSLRILVGDGNDVRTLASTFTNATCGTGCRGTFSVAVPFKINTEQQGTIEVFESSARDGSPIHVVRIPVTLTP
jgi:hypothetical protein